jgi:hypothetical protein
VQGASKIQNTGGANFFLFSTEPPAKYEFVLATIGNFSQDISHSSAYDKLSIVARIISYFCGGYSDVNRAAFSHLLSGGNKIARKKTHAPRLQLCTCPFQICVHYATTKTAFKLALSGFLPESASPALRAKIINLGHLFGLVIWSWIKTIP